MKMDPWKNREFSMEHFNHRSMLQIRQHSVTNNFRKNIRGSEDRTGSGNYFKRGKNMRMVKKSFYRMIVEGKIIVREK